jgi:hypothetical protein
MGGWLVDDPTANSRRTMQLGIVAQEVFSFYRFKDWECQ